MDLILAAHSAPKRASNSDWSPVIPCAACARPLRYTDAVAISVGDVLGFGHPTGLCDPKDVADVAATRARHLPQRNNRG